MACCVDAAVSSVTTRAERVFLAEGSLQSASGFSFDFSSWVQKRKTDHGLH